jgi:hypothetical protein
VLQAAIYAVAALAAGVVVVIGYDLHYPAFVMLTAGALFCFWLRVMALYRGWHLPVAQSQIGAIESSFVTSFQDLWFKLAVQERYKLSLFLRLLSRSLRGIAVRPLPCNYYVIQ